MVEVTRLNGSKLVINALMIETIEETPDTIITLSNGKKFVVKDSSNQIVKEVQNYLKEIGLLNLKTIERGGANE